jgi:pyrophosphatase PpaX
MKQYEYFLLDWDGNLAKTLDVWLEACKTVMEKRGLRPSDTEIGASFGAFIEYLGRWGVTDIEAAFDEMDSIAKQKLPEVELYPDALEVLERLKDAGKKLALITTSSHENIAHLLAKHNVSRFFDVIIAGDDVQQHKPNPEPLEKALQLLGAKDKRLAVMIGDSDKDIGAAKNTGVDSILFYPPEHHKFYNFDDLKRLNPTYTVSDFREILGAI